MSYPSQLAGQKAGPVPAAERLVSLDVLRGVAVMGILVMNIYAFAMPFAAYYNPTIMGGSDVLLEMHGFDPLYVARYGGIPNYFGSILVAFGHIGAVMLVTRSSAWRGLVDRVAAVGRTALSNYLIHSIVMTSVFYGFGLGLYGEVPRVTQQAFVIAMLALQLIVSPWWLGYFRFGPAEWLWRSLTYGQRQPMRR